MSSDSLDKGYDPSGIEEKWYQYWVDNGSFKASEKSDQKPYSIVIPPAQYYGCPSHGPCLEQHRAGHHVPS